MSPGHTTLTHYLEVRRALGCKLQETGTLLHQFVHFVHQEGATSITTALALRWATQPQRPPPAHWARRLGMVRRFAQYCRALDTRTEVPPHGVLPYRYRRQPPYMYNEQEISRLLAAARQLPSVTGRRSCTSATLLGLLAVTGMRLSEALHLDRTDVELTHGHLTIRQTTFGKTRWIPLHPSTRDALHPYARCRDQRWRTPHTPRFFLSARGPPLTVWSVRQPFVTLSHQIGLRGATERHGPRRHALRHTFAVRTLLAWYRTGVHVEQRLPTLTADLGHTHVNDTYGYLSAIPALFYEVTQRFETHLKENAHAD
jgi:integrase/recombinase XerD